MITEQIFYGIRCDRCHEDYEGGDYSYVPLPYYDGPIDIKDCTEPELMKAIY